MYIITSFMVYISVSMEKERERENERERCFSMSFFRFGAFIKLLCSSFLSQVDIGDREEFLGRRKTSGGILIIKYVGL